MSNTAEEKARSRRSQLAGIALVALGLALEGAFLVHLSLVDRAPQGLAAAAGPIRPAVARCVGRPGERC
jgi:hypothetical protein